MVNLISLGSLACGALAATHEFDWTLSWVNANLDGEKERQVVGINGVHPLPVLNITKGDRIVAKVTNQLENPSRNTSFHWHGLFQNGTNYADGPVMMNQCPQPPNTTVTYNFTIDQPGSYWYHAHVEDLYPDGQRQMLLVSGDEEDRSFTYDEEIAFSMQDWYHDLYEIIRNRDFMSLYNPTGAEPVPQNILINETADPLKVKLEVGKTYRLRVISTSTFSAFYWFMENQNLTIVETDGTYVDPQDAQVIEMGVGQRYSVLFTPQEDNTIYRFCQMADQSLYDVVPPELQLNHTMFFYTGDNHADDDFKNMEIADIAAALGVSEDDATTSDFLDDLGFDDSTLSASDGMKTLQDPKLNITLNLTLTNLLDGVNYAFFNDISYTKPKTPTLNTILSAPNDDLANNETIYGSNTHTYIAEHMDVVQIALNNDDTGKHPFHLHGHNFQVLIRAPIKGDGADEDDFWPYSPDDPDDPEIPDVPVRRDVLIVRPYSHFLIRFLADNPGVWIFHCHIEWHLTQGLAMQIVEAPLQVRQNQKIPQDFLDICKANNIPTDANAAGRNDNWTNLEGEPLQVKDLPNGFTARGIVALVFSCICAFIGMGFLTWYGISETPVAEFNQVKHAVHIYEDEVDAVAHEDAHK